MSVILHLVFLAIYGLYVFFKMDRTKPLPWLLAHMSLVGAGAYAIFAHSEIYLLAGSVAGLLLAAKSLFIDKLPFSSNVMMYLKAFITNALFSPVSAFETIYQWVATKVKLPTLPKV